MTLLYDTEATINNLFKLFTDATVTVGSFVSAMISVKRGRPLINLVEKLSRVVVGRITNSNVRVIISFLSHCSQLAKTNGLRFLCIYLKTQYVNLQQSVAGHPLRDLTPLGCRVSRTGRGCPRVIPILHRMWISKGSHFHIRFWLSLFSLYRVVEFPGRVKLATITDPFGGRDLSSLLPSYSHFVCDPFRLSLEKKFSTEFLWDCIHDRREALKSLPIRPFPISKSTPVVTGHISTSFSALIMTLHAWRFSPLLPFLQDWMKLTKNTRFLNWFEKGLEFSKGRLKDTFPNLPLGKLGLKDEPAGKVRVFAMVDCITQWVFHPLHARVFEILKLIPQDGTFDQERPLKHLGVLGRAGRKLDSFDLSAATDRLPVKVQATLLSSFIGAHAANIWMVLLVSREYALPERARDSSGLNSVYYAVGQPMGALTSWAMLALTHHSLVQWAAFRAGEIKRGEWFSDYAILGDDMVLANPKVSKEYLEVLKEMGVQVGLAKSLTSTSGALEFAKRFIVGNVNLSPVPILEVVAAMRSLPAMVELMRKYKLSISTIAGIAGFGYRACGSINSSLASLGSRLRTLVLAARSAYVTPANLVEFLSYTGEKPRQIEKSDLQSYRDRFAASMLKRIKSLGPAMVIIRDLVTVDRSRVHYGTIDMDPPSGVSNRRLRITNPDPDMEYHPSIDVGPLPPSFVERQMTGTGLAYPYGGPQSGQFVPPSGIDHFLRHFIVVNSVGRGPRTYRSNYYFRTELGPICTSYDECLAEMRAHITAEDTRFIHSLYEYVYRECYLDVLSEIARVRTTLEESTDFDIEDMVDILLNLDSLETDLAAVATPPRTYERKTEPIKTRSVLRFVKMWKSL